MKSNKHQNLYCTHPRMSSPRNSTPTKSFTIWFTENKSNQPALAMADSKWLLYSPEEVYNAILQGEPLNWNGPVTPFDVAT